MKAGKKILKKMWFYEFDAIQVDSRSKTSLPKIKSICEGLVCVQTE